MFRLFLISGIIIITHWSIWRSVLIFIVIFKMIQLFSGMRIYHYYPLIYLDNCLHFGFHRQCFSDFWDEDLLPTDLFGWVFSSLLLYSQYFRDVELLLLLLYMFINNLLRVIFRSLVNMHATDNTVYRSTSKKARLISLCSWTLLWPNSKQLMKGKKIMLSILEKTKLLPYTQKGPILIPFIFH